MGAKASDKKNTGRKEISLKKDIVGNFGDNKDIKIIADKGIWIEFLKNNPNIFSKMQVLLENNRIFWSKFYFQKIIAGSKGCQKKQLFY